MDAWCIIQYSTYYIVSTMEKFTTKFFSYIYLFFKPLCGKYMKEIRNPSLHFNFSQSCVILSLFLATCFFLVLNEDNNSLFTGLMGYNEIKMMK
jgi:hypothetical protein